MVNTITTTPTLPTGAINRYGRHWPKTALRLVFGLIWLIDATLKWLPGFRSGYMDTIMGQADGQPGWLKPWFRFWINLQHPAPAFYAYTVAAIETLIAVAVIFGFARKLTYSAAIVFSLLIWATAEGFGGPYTAGAADIGTALIYALVFAALLSFSFYQGPAPYSADRWLEQRISWWHWVAEVGHHDDSASAPPMIEPRHHRRIRHAAVQVATGDNEAPDLAVASAPPTVGAPNGNKAATHVQPPRVTVPAGRQ